MTLPVHRLRFCRARQARSNSRTDFSSRRAFFLSDRIFAFWTKPATAFISFLAQPASPHKFGDAIDAELLPHEFIAFDYRSFPEREADNACLDVGAQQGKLERLFELSEEILRSGSSSFQKDLSAVLCRTLRTRVRAMRTDHMEVAFAKNRVTADMSVT